ncbi:MAG: Fe-S cluster assembly protein IscX [Phycisphaerales bacterium]|nr:Fe-S cluster assembly protein IscX [Phycisphaerales bacterium]
MTYGWLDIHRIAEELADAHPGRDPLKLRFVELRAMVERLPGFAADPSHPVNEKILESIQMAWVGEGEGGEGEEEEAK